MIMDAAGLTNISADVHDTWTSLGWEPVVDADPDVIVLVDAAWNTADAKIALLESNPATARARPPSRRSVPRRAVPGGRGRRAERRRRAVARGPAGRSWR